jgi:hypothetical protein
VSLEEILGRGTLQMKPRGVRNGPAYYAGTPSGDASVAEPPPAQSHACEPWLATRREALPRAGEQRLKSDAADIAGRDPSRSISAGGDYEPPVPTEHGAVEVLAVASEGVQAVAAGGIPDPRRRIAAGGDHEPPARAEHGPVDAAAVATEGVQAATTEKRKSSTGSRALVEPSFRVQKTLATQTGEPIRYRRDGAGL